MKEAVEDCLEGAGWVWRVTGQQELLRAAIYGRSNAPSVVDAALVPHTALHCRVLNSLRIASGVRLLSRIVLCVHGEIEPLLPQAWRVFEGKCVSSLLDTCKVCWLEVAQRTLCYSESSCTSCAGIPLFFLPSLHNLHAQTLGGK
jgi:hypothetical protein